MNIGVFDSGIGGLSVARAIESALPEHNVVFRYDHAHFPYGGKKPAELLALVTPILQSLVEDGCSVIVIACNTVTTNIINDLKGRIAVPLIGVEPLVAEATRLSKTGIITVCATPGTLSSHRYINLKATYTNNVTVLEPDCSDWAAMIEQNRTNELRLSEQINAVCERGSDVIVLGCTHYHWIEEDILQLAAGRAIVIQPELQVIDDLRQALTRLVETV